MRSACDFTLGAIFGMGVILGINKISCNKDVVKKHINSIIDDTSKLID